MSACPSLRAVNYEVYPGSAFYLTQMVDSVSYPYVAQFANGFYDPHWDYVRSNLLVSGCTGSGVDAPVYLYRNYGSFDQQVIWDRQQRLRDGENSAGSATLHYP